MSLEGKIRSEEPWYKSLFSDPISYAEKAVIDPVDNYLLRTAARVGEWIESKSKNYDRYDITLVGGVAVLVGRVGGWYTTGQTSSSVEALSLEATILTALMATVCSVVDIAAFLAPFLRFLARSGGAPLLQERVEALLSSPGVQSFRKFARCVAAPIVLGSLGYAAISSASEYVHGGRDVDIFPPLVNFLISYSVEEGIIYVDSTDKQTLNQKEG